MITRKNIHRRCASAEGFTLMEVVISIVIVGTAIVSLMMLFASGTTVNQYGNDLSMAVFLADQLRSMTDENNIDELLINPNQTFNGVDASGIQIAGLEQYQQNLQVQSINPDDMTVYVGPDVDAVLVTATVTKAGKELTSVSWLRTR